MLVSIIFYDFIPNLYMKIDYNSSTRMMNKENKIPNKQGVLF